jgi:hypothetical protein
MNDATDNETAIAIAARVEAFVRGNASSAHAEKMVAALPVIAQRAWEQALGAHP